MSQLGGNYSQYGTYQKGYDHNMFYTKNSARIIFAGTGAVGSTAKFLKRPYDNNTQGLYVPEETYGMIFLNFVAVNDTDDTVYTTVADGSAYGTFENDGGTTGLIVTPAEVFVSGYTLTVAANDTVDALEVSVVDSGDGGDTLYITATLDMMWVNTIYGAGQGNTTNPFPAITTGALSAVETPVA